MSSQSERGAVCRSRGGRERPFADVGGEERVIRVLRKGDELGGSAGDPRGITGGSGPKIWDPGL